MIQEQEIKHFVSWTHMIDAIGLDEFVLRVRGQIKEADGLLTEAAAAHLVWVYWKSSKTSEKRTAES